MIQTNYPVNKSLSDYEINLPEFWNDIYDQGNPAWGKAPANVLEKFINYFPSQARVLDIGCGEGRNSVPLSKKGFNVHGIDISQSAINVANSRESSCQFTCADIFHIEFKEKFDVAIDFGLFHFVPPHLRQSYLDKVFSFLNDGGVYCNQTGRLGERRIGSDEYTPPQFSKKEIEDSFNNYQVIIIDEDTLPSHSDYSAYPCWNIVLKK